MEDRRAFFIILLVSVAIGSTLIGLAISRSGGERGRQLMERTISGREASFSREACPPGCVYLPVITINTGVTEQADRNTSDPMIRVSARTSPACDETGGNPVAGARVAVITESDTLAGVTDGRGLSVFGAADGPATVQIEWPAGYLPCPNSRPFVELPDGAGDVTFTARSPGYP